MNSVWLQWKTNNRSEITDTTALSGNFHGKSRGKMRKEHAFQFSIHLAPDRHGGKRADVPNRQHLHGNILGHGQGDRDGRGGNRIVPRSTALPVNSPAAQEATAVRRDLQRESLPGQVLSQRPSNSRRSGGSARSLRRTTLREWPAPTFAFWVCPAIFSLDPAAGDAEKDDRQRSGGEKNQKRTKCDHAMLRGCLFITIRRISRCFVGGLFARRRAEWVS